MKRTIFLAVTCAAFATTGCVVHVKDRNQHDAADSTYDDTGGGEETVIVEGEAAPPPPRPRVVVYAHGHARHNCRQGHCRSWRAPRPRVVVYAHGHARHNCRQGHCRSWRAPRPRVVVYAHGHARHNCRQGHCRSWRAPRPRVVVYGHGHARHHCDRSCRDYRPVVIVKRPPARLFVGGYKSRYRNLADMGRTKDYFRSHGRKGSVDQGYLRGDWKCHGVGIFKRGAGHGKTVIDGNLEIKGNNWRLTNITVTGSVKIRGNNNNITGLELLRPGSVSVKGSGNKVR